MELGNQIVNRVYEARVDDSVRRASEMCDGPVREAWIRAKYVDRRFVRPIMFEESDDGQKRRDNGTSSEEMGGGATPAKVARRWSVRRLRRRPNSKSRQSGSSGAAVGGGDERMKVIDEDAKSNVSGGSVVVIGGDLCGTAPLKDEMALSSDQESTGEEDNSALGELKVDIQ